MNKKENKGNPGTRAVPLEDLALKAAAQYFGEELLPYLGITEKIVGIAPTEQVELIVRHLYQDFNYVLEKKKSWLHLEFESDSIKREDLKRFREYEATTSRVYDVSVVTCVICTSSVKEIMSELLEGINVYRVQMVRLKDSDADALFLELLAPLMSGSSSIKERVVKGMNLLQSELVQVSQNEIKAMQSVLYTLANKFLNPGDLKDIKEMISMTILGQMIMEDGIEKGIEKGIRALIQDYLEEGVSKECILGKLQKHFELPLEKAAEYYNEYVECH